MSDERRPKTIGLCLIVKNETRVIERCLDSILGFADYVLVEDTGSTDGTQALIRDWLKRNAMPGEVIEEPWRDFAYNRSHVMAQLRQVAHVDYAFFMDADDRFAPDAGFDARVFKADMRHDLYDVEIRHGGSRFFRPQLCSNRIPFVFKSILHEYLEVPPGPLSRDNAQGFHVQTGEGGVRSSNPRKFQDDAAALEKALLTETDPFLISRYTFYLAQSYRDAGEREQALANYLKRAELGYWDEEVFESLYAAAKLKEGLGHRDEEVITAYHKAIAAVATRAEALHGLARFCRIKGRNEEGFQYARRGLEIPLPTGGLFVERWIYEYGLLDEVAINGYWSGHHREALDAALKMLACPELPESERGRVLQNARFSFEQLPAPPNMGSLGKSTMVDQHRLAPERSLRSRIDGQPKVLIAILAKQKEKMLPLYLACIEALDYPKSSIVLYIRTNNNTDRTEPMLREWVERVRPLYAAIEFDAEDVMEPVQQFAVHEWNETRLRVLGGIRNVSMGKTLAHGCDFYFVADVDCFLRPCTLRELVALDLPIVAPLLRSLAPLQFLSNYAAEVDSMGYLTLTDQYHWILNRWVRGVHEVPLVHVAYLIRADAMPGLSCQDMTERYEYVVLSDSARKAGVPQYIDNRQVYGYMAFDEDSPVHVPGGLALAREMLAAALTPEAPQAPAPAVPLPSIHRNARPRLFACMGLLSSGSTWLYNLARDICKSQGVEFISGYRDMHEDLPWDAPGAPMLIVKSHNPTPAFRSFIATSGEPAIVTVRDPRDAVVSLRQRFSKTSGSSFESALEATCASAACMLDARIECSRLPVVRYEDKFVDARETFDLTAFMLGLRPSEEQRENILAGLSASAVREKIRGLEAEGAIQGEDKWDNDTHWHAKHVGDGRVGKFRESLTAEEEGVILERTWEYRAAFGYSISEAV